MARGFRDDRGKWLHPYLPELCELLRKEHCGRREFLRTATLLGVSAGAAYAMAGRLLGEGIAAATETEVPKTGGRLRSAMRVERMDDPATFDWPQMSNLTRQIVEYLTITGSDNITRPYLAESWEASEDLKTWTLRLRRDVRWNNGDDFTADDVVFNFLRWLNPDTGSSNISLFSGLLETTEGGSRRVREGAIEKLDTHTIRLNLSAPDLTVPENLYNYPTAILHRRFEEMGGNLERAPIGTGPYELAEFRAGERCVLRRRPEGYWGGDVHLDEIVYLDHGDQPSAGLEALATGEVEHVYEVDIGDIDRVQQMDGVVLMEAVTAQTAVARMRLTAPPFDNAALRKAIATCMDHGELLQMAYRGRGAVGENHHVAPIHPEYFKLPPLSRNLDRAKALLSESGVELPLKLSIDLGNSDAWHEAACRGFSRQLAPAGIELSLNVMPGAEYRRIWNQTSFGFTSWTHRPLGVMVLNLAYKSGVPWNETRYANPEFDAALADAAGTLDVNARRQKMETVERILQRDAVIAQPLWRSVFSAISSRVRDFRMHPTLYHQLHGVWLED